MEVKAKLASLGASSALHGKLFLYLGIRYIIFSSATMQQLDDAALVKRYVKDCSKQFLGSLL